MVYRFLIVSDEVDDFMREIKINSNATFLEFHDAIREACGYEDGQKTSFTICEDGWQKQEEITLEDTQKDSDEDSYVMRSTRLDEFLEDEKQHLIYTFDPLADRVFFIELSEIITKKQLGAPVVSRSQGNPPQQFIDFDELLAQNPINISDSSIDEDIDLYDDGIDEDIDLEGLDITEGEPF